MKHTVCFLCIRRGFFDHSIQSTYQNYFIHAENNQDNSGVREGTVFIEDDIDESNKCKPSEASFCQNITEGVVTMNITLAISFRASIDN